eukprot:248004-Prorocentrum_minimum.AAC.1
MAQRRTMTHAMEGCVRRVGFEAHLLRLSKALRPSSAVITLRLALLVPMGRWSRHALHILSRKGSTRRPRYTLRNSRSRTHPPVGEWV